MSTTPIKAKKIIHSRTHRLGVSKVTALAASPKHPWSAPTLVSEVGPANHGTVDLEAGTRHGRTGWNSETVTMRNIARWTSQDEKKK